MYPAAHSMDVDWYAVDADGNVALCFSDEMGGVPEDAHCQYRDELVEDWLVARIASASPDDPYSERGALLRALAAASDPAERGLVQAILDGDAASKLVYADWLEAHGRTCDGWSPHAPALYQIADRLHPIELAATPDVVRAILRFTEADGVAAFRDERLCDEYRELDAALGMPHAIAVTSMPDWLLSKYLSSGTLAAAYIIAGSLEPAALGLYEYACPWSGDYERTGVPASPSRIDELPASLRDKLAALRSRELRFATTEVLDPEDLGPCSYYGR